MTLHLWVYPRQTTWTGLMSVLVKCPNAVKHLCVRVCWLGCRRFMLCKKYRQCNIEVGSIDSTDWANYWKHCRQTQKQKLHCCIHSSLVLCINWYRVLYLPSVRREQRKVCLWQFIWVKLINVSKRKQISSSFQTLPRFKASSHNKLNYFGRRFT